MNRTKRLVLFGALVTGSVVGFLLVIAWYLSSYQAGHGSFGGVMGQMMGGSSTAGLTSPMPGYVWGTIAAFGLLAVLGIAGVAYYLALPEITSKQVQPEAQEIKTEPRESPRESWDTILRTSDPEEGKVLKVLAAHGGTYLQKFVVKESGLSKLKTHRIVSRFAQRGIVTSVKSGNTNELTLAEWLKAEISNARPPEN